MAKMSPMIDMSMDDEDSLDAPMPYPMAEKPQYPYGLRICLTTAELDKLGVSHEDAFVGGIVHLHALAEITCVSCNDSGDGPCARVEMTITHLALESEDEENSAYE